MSKKIIIILTAVLGILLLGVILFAALYKPKAPATVTVKGTSGDITVNNFSTNPVAQGSDQSNIKQTANYDIIYFIKEQIFQIDLLAQPLKTVRSQAEQDFLSTLGITQDSACKLNVMEKTPYSVDPNYAGTNLGLSFCPNAVQITEQQSQTPTSTSTTNTSTPLQVR